MNENKQLLAINANINAKDYGITDDDAVIIAQPFAAKAQELAAMQDDIDKIMSADITRELAIDAGKLRKRIVPLRTGVAAIHKELKASALARGRYIDSYKNSFNEISKNHEDNLRDIEEHYDIIEAKRIADLQAERESLIKPLLNEFAPMPHKLGEMADDLWDDYYEEAKQVHADRIEAKAARDKIIADEAKVKALRADREAQIKPFLDGDIEDDLANLDDDEFRLFLLQAKEAYNYRVSARAKAKADAEAKAKAEQVARDAEAKRLADVKAAEDKVRREAQAEAEAEKVTDETAHQKPSDGGLTVGKIPEPFVEQVEKMSIGQAMFERKRLNKKKVRRMKSMLSHFISSQPTLEESPAKVVRERKAMELIAELSRIIND